AEVARRFGVDLGIEVVLLAPQRVGWILVLEILNQPGAIEFAVPEVARQCGQPAAAKEAAAIAHRILAVHATPIRQRRPADDQRAKHLGSDRRGHHDPPAGLAIADDARLAVRLRMPCDDLLEEDRFGAADVFDRLSWHRIRQEADEITRMAGLERDADLAVGLEPSDARAMP